jgi:hypothetical protein
MLHVIAGFSDEPTHPMLLFFVGFEVAAFERIARVV